jgi:predicted porin
MNKSLLALAVLGSIGFSASAQTSVTIFGVLDVSIKRVHNGSAGSITSEATGDNSSSRIGLRGSEDLGGGLKAEFWLESDVSVDTGVGGQLASASNTFASFWNRRSTVALVSASLGELRFGRDYVPTHGVVCVYDPFGCVGPAQVTTFRGGHAVNATAFPAGESTLVRANNVIRYYLPSTLGGVFGDVFVSLGEGAATSAGGASKTAGARLGYAQGPIHASYATISTKNTAIPGADLVDTAFGASYDFGVVKLGFAHRSYKLDARRAGESMIAATVPLGQGLLKATYVRARQYGTNAANVDVSANSASLIGAGYDYFLSKRTVLYTAIARVANENGAKYTISGGPAGMLAGETSSAYELGIRHSF